MSKANICPVPPSVLLPAVTIYNILLAARKPLPQATDVGWFIPGAVKWRRLPPTVIFISASIFWCVASQALPSQYVVKSSQAETSVLARARISGSDVEAFEFNQNIVTEIGISTLDTIDLRGLQPGAKGSNWAAKIRSRHFHIREHSHRINKVQVEGCPNKFDFSQNERVSKQDVISVLKRCFNPSRSPYFSETCKVVLIRHDVVANMNYLNK